MKKGGKEKLFRKISRSKKQYECKKDSATPQKSELVFPYKKKSYIISLSNLN